MRLNYGIASVCFFAVALLCLCLPSAEAALFFERWNHSALWKIENADSTVYVFGYYHVLKAGTRWVPTSFRNVTAEVDEFVFEVEPTDERNAS
jgi:uncharacterized protein YbaP (TraB family)